MNGNAARFLRLGVSLSGLVVLGWVLTGQAARPAKHGIPLPNDWTHSRVIFSRPGTAEQLARVSHDPRYQQQIHRREEALTLPAGVDAGAFVPPALKWHRKKFKGDWAEDLGAGATAGAANYPAKYSFSSTIANCGNATTPDYVVYSTGLAGSSTQASVVAYDNIYSGCSGFGPVPSMYWAYNTGGQILTSPVLSKDGSQVAFVETSGGFGLLTIVRWAAAPSDTISNPETLAVTPPGSYQGCIAPCMTQVLLRDGSNNQTDDTTSWAFYDYNSDVAFVGGALGWLHKITGVFKGTPTEVITGGFPVQLNTTTWLSSPVFDGVSTVFVGDASGYLYRVNSSNGAFVRSGQLDFGTGLLGSPVVDVTNGFVYAFASSDGLNACPGGVSCAAVYQLSTTFGAVTTGTKVVVGNSLVYPGSTPNPLFVGAFDSTYYNSVGANGNLYVCGNTGASPTLYQIPFTAGVPGASVAVTTLTTASTAACSGVTDLPNPNTAGGPSERLFVSVQDKGIATTCGGGGCIFNFVDTPWKASTSYAVGQRVLSSNLAIETVISPGTSGATAPGWSNSAGGTTTDGGVTWIDGGVLSALTSVWLSSHNYAIPTDHIIDSNGNIEVSTTPGTSGSTPPIWNTTPGGTTSDGTDTLVWTNAGKVPTAAAPVAGGTSGRQHRGVGYIGGRFSDILHHSEQSDLRDIRRHWWLRCAGLATGITIDRTETGPLMAMNDTSIDKPSIPVTRKPYEKPSFRYERVFVTSALSCGKTIAEGQCSGRTSAS